MSEPNGKVDMDAVMRDDHIIEQAGRKGVRAALLDHKRTGDPIVVWENGRVVWIPADQIEVDETPPSSV